MGVFWVLKHVVCPKLPFSASLVKIGEGEPPMQHM